MLDMKWEALAAGLVLVIGAIGKFILDYQKGKREAKASDDRLQVLRDIAQSNAAIREGQLAQNGKLSVIMEVNGARHEEMIRTMNSSCKAKPIFPTTGEQQKENKHEKHQSTNRTRNPWHNPSSMHGSGSGDQSRRDGQH